MLSPQDAEGLPMPNREVGLFEHARPGDTLMIPFQCELCHFRNICKRDPSYGSTSDVETLKYLRRANLDTFWSRRSSTVSGNLRYFNTLRTMSHEAGMHLMPERGPHILEDNFGAGLAVVVLKKSLTKGRNDKFVQFSTARRMRSTYSNFWYASVNTPLTGLSNFDDKRSSFLSEAPSSSFWFSRFIQGFHGRVGDKVKQDLGISFAVMKEMMDIFEARYESDPSDALNIEMAYFCYIAWLGALRGNEVLYADLGETGDLVVAGMTMKSEQMKPHVPLVLQGKFKNATSISKHIFLFSCRKDLEFAASVKTWTLRMLKLRKREGRTRGWMFAYKEGPKKGEPLNMTAYESDIMDVLEEIQERRPDLIPKGLDVKDEYGVFRSFRRGASTAARNARVSPEDIELNNGWRLREAARGRHVSSDMLSYYTELSQSSKSLVRFSEALLVS